MEKWPLDFPHLSVFYNLFVDYFVAIKVIHMRQPHGFQRRFRHHQGSFARAVFLADIIDLLLDLVLGPGLDLAGAGSSSSASSPTSIKFCAFRACWLTTSLNAA